MNVSLVKEHEPLWMGSARRMLLLKWAVSAGFISGLLLSGRLWMTDRGFPTLSPIGLPDLPQSTAVCLYWALVLMLLLVAVLPRPAFAIYGAVLLVAVLVAFDITRLQPWVYQYSLLLLALSMMRWDEPTSVRSKAAWAACAFVIVATYCWSGLQKMNVSFYHEVFPWLIRPFAGDELPYWLRYFAYAVPIIETSLGILLFVPRTRTLGLIGVVAMHGFLILALGLGQNYNSVVWPWNLWMAVIAFALFLRNDAPVAAAWTSGFGKAIVLLFGVLPPLSFVDRWDDYLSASLYSGRSRLAFLELSRDASRYLPRSALPLLQGNDPVRLDIGDWAIRELNVPPYPEPRVYAQIVQKLRQRGIKATLFVRDRPGLTGSAPPFRESPAP
jgi:hypothetical protein